MPKLPRVTARQLIQVLSKKGFYQDRQKGSHIILVHPITDKTVVVPDHHARVLGDGLTLAILKDAGVSREEFTKLL